MKIKTSELTGAALDWAVAKAEGRALREPRRGTDAEAALKQVPFTMFEPVATQHADGSVSYRVESITVTRFGNLPGCSAPTISFKDCDGRTARGSTDLFYFDLTEAELDCQGSKYGWLDGFKPSTDWAQGGPIIERELHNLFKWNQLDPKAPELWCGVHNRKTDSGIYAINMDGPTPLIAAMRCYVASKLGDEVEVPDELA